MKNTVKLILCLCGPLLVGGIAGFATATSVDTWYLTLHKPSFNPPNYLFGPVWSLLYLLMGVSFYMILQAPESDQRKRAIIIFYVQLALNFLWSFLFFKFQLVGIAFIEIICMWVSIITMIVLFSKVHKRAAYLQIPYLLWVSFASVLNGAILFLN